MVSYQFLLVPPALALAVAPLVSVVRGRNRSVRDAYRDDRSALPLESGLQSVGDLRESGELIARVARLRDGSEAC